VVHDQVGSPAYTNDLAILLADMVRTDRYGVYHATNEGFCSWYDFACEIIRLSGGKASVRPVSSDQYPTKALRPKNSRLSKRSLDAAGFNRLPPWQDALKRYFASC
jgi:dTDP-4-dehydrorhamnose reductase